jgi:hypothetical protein
MTVVYPDCPALWSQSYQLTTIIIVHPPSLLRANWTVQDFYFFNKKFVHDFYFFNKKIVQELMSLYDLRNNEFIFSKGWDYQLSCH